MACVGPHRPSPTAVSMTLSGAIETVDCPGSPGCGVRDVASPKEVKGTCSHQDQGWPQTLWLTVSQQRVLCVPRLNGRAVAGVADTVLDGEAACPRRTRCSSAPKETHVQKVPT